MSGRAKGDARRAAAAPAGRAAGDPRRAGPARTAQAPQEVRLIGGLWKRSRLPVPALPGLRPTPARVRETLFDWLGHELAGWRCLDAFAGTGALGLEAASRGAAEVCLVERDARLVRQLRETVARLKATGVRVEQGDALRWLAAQAPASLELVLLDPPFDAGLFVPALRAAAPALVPGGWVYLEADRPVEGDEAGPAGLRLHRRLKAGAVHAQLFQREDPAAGTGTGTEAPGG